MFTSLFNNKINTAKSAQTSMSNTDETTKQSSEEKPKEHGEDGVCCGGCGGE